MKTVLAVAAIAVLVAASAWALTSSEPPGSPYTVEVRNVAGVSTLTAVPGHCVTPEVTSSAGQMLEVLVRATVATAAAPGLGVELVN